MKIWQKALLALCTAAALAAGFFLPDLVGTLQARTAQQTVQLTLAGGKTSETPEVTLLDKLVAATGSDFRESVELTTGRTMREGDAAALALGYMERFTESFGLSTKYKTVDTRAYYAVCDPQQSTAFSIWACELEGSGGEHVGMLLDDETGCILKLSMHVVVPENMATPDGYSACWMSMIGNWIWQLVGERLGSVEWMATIETPVSGAENTPLLQNPWPLQFYDPVSGKNFSLDLYQSGPGDFEFNI